MRMRKLSDSRETTYALFRWLNFFLLVTFYSLGWLGLKSESSLNHPKNLTQAFAFDRLSVIYFELPLVPMQTA